MPSKATDYYTSYMYFMSSYYCDQQTRRYCSSTITYYTSEMY